MRGSLKTGPLLYAAVLVAAAVAGYLYQLRTQGIFACTASGYYAPPSYLAYCDAKAYGDYDHGAFWYGLEPEAVRRASGAQVLFLGSSRMQFAFSSQATDQWFAAAASPHYLMGFTHTENATFAAPLLERLKPRARVYVINVDRFFADRETDPGADLLHDRNEAPRRYHQKQLWQGVHRRLCTRLTTLCGNSFAYYRSESTGHWKVRGHAPGNKSLTADAAHEDSGLWPSEGLRARRFIASLPVDPGCVVLTIVPYPGTRHAEARAIAAAAGQELIDPPLEGLRTFDGSHLDQASAERFSGAFYDLAGARIRRCLAPASTAVAGSAAPLRAG
ncbi:MAG: hypothetical protein U1F35_19290 [Steroidobacteraceae bacterium]